MPMHNLLEYSSKNKKFLNRFLKDIKLGWKHLQCSDFIFDCANSLYYTCHKINLNHGGSYIDFLDWIKIKKATINPAHGDDECFQYTARVP